MVEARTSNDGKRIVLQVHSFSDTVELTPFEAEIFAKQLNGAIASARGKTRPVRRLGEFGR